MDDINCVLFLVKRHIKTFSLVIYILQGEDESNQQKTHISTVSNRSKTMSAPRKISDVWKNIDEQRVVAKMGKHEWRQSHQGIKAALLSIGLVLLTSKKELDDMDVPLRTNGGKQYAQRCVYVSRNGKISPGISIVDLLTGNNSLRTEEEMKAVWDAQSAKKSLAQPKGIPCGTNVESKAIDDLDCLIGVSDHMRREHLIEFRAYDIAYSAIGAGDVFVADQVKTSRVGTYGGLTFHVKVKDMISILGKGSLTCIGTRDGDVDVVWYFTAAAIITLNTFDMDQTFNPRLHLKTACNKRFTMAMQSEMFRFEVGKSNANSKVECDRLLRSKIGFLATGKKEKLKFWNEDMSQIPSKNHKVEQRSMNLMQEACVANGSIYTKPHDIMYSPIDFLINGVRVQDKAMDKSKKFNVCANGGLPYNPDDLDVFQVTVIEDEVVYVMSMRLTQPDGTVTSSFPADTLMKKSIEFSLKWQETHKQFKHDLKTPEGTKSYVDACIAAGKIPPLTDRTFYSKMLADNQNNIGSKRQLAERRLQKKNNTPN